MNCKSKRPDERENNLLINEAVELKTDLPKLTKRSTVKRLSKFFAKVRQKSFPLLKELFVEAKKELFKRMISGGFNNVGKYIDLIQLFRPLYRPPKTKKAL